MEERTCSSCGVTKPITEYRYVGGGDKHRQSCKRCVYDKEAAYRRQHKERYRAHYLRRYAESKKRTKDDFVLVEAKRCSRCGEIRQASEFTPVSHTRDGLTTRCRKCLAEVSRERYRTKEGRRKALEYAKEYHSRPKVKKRLRAYAKSPERKAYFKAHAKTEAFKRTQRKYAGTPKGKVTCMLRTFRRRVKIAGNGESLLQAKDIAEIFRQKGRNCAYCGEIREFMEIDHQIPIELGGTNAIENLWPACRACNRAKGPRFWELGCRMKKGT